MSHAFLDDVCMYCLFCMYVTLVGDYFFSQVGIIRFELRIHYFFFFQPNLFSHSPF